MQKCTRQYYRNEICYDRLTVLADRPQTSAQSDRYTSGSLTHHEGNVKLSSWWWRGWWWDYFLEHLRSWVHHEFCPSRGTNQALGCLALLQVCQGLLVLATARYGTFSRLTFADVIAECTDCVAMGAFWTTFSQLDGA